MTQPVMVVDCNYLCHRARFTTGAMEYEGRLTGVIYGFLSQMHVLSQELAPSNVVFTWDSKSSLRRDRFPFYKNGRKKQVDPDIEQHYRQFDELRQQILPEMGFKNNFMQDGFEADDIIASITNNLQCKTVIASSDEDLFQLLTRKTSMYNLKKRTLLTWKGLYSEKGITPRKWVEVKKIAGCSGDGVPGIVGVGEKTAIDYLRNKLKSNSKKTKDIESAEGQAVIQRNDWLVRLPLPGTPTYQIQNNQFNVQELKRVCKYYGFKKFTNNEAFFEDWRIYFEHT